jgi:hypothetical protein
MNEWSRSLLDPTVQIKSRTQMFDLSTQIYGPAISFLSNGRDPPSGLQTFPPPPFSRFLYLMSHVQLRIDESRRFWDFGLQ